MGKFSALKGLAKGAARQTDTLARKTSKLVQQTTNVKYPGNVPMADLSRGIRTPELGLEDGFALNRYSNSEKLKLEASNGEYNPRDRRLGSTSEDTLYGTDGRGTKPEEFVDEVKQVQQDIQANGIQPSTLRTSESLNNIRVNEDGIPRYTEPVPMEDPTISGRTQGGDGGKAGLTNTGRTKEEISRFTDAKARQTVGPFKHHHILDMDFLGRVLNRQDYREILGHLKTRFGIEGGDRAGNIIGMMDEKTNFRRFSGQDSIVKQWSENPNRPDVTATTWKEATKEQQRIATDLLKSFEKGPTDPASWGLPQGKPKSRGYAIGKYWPEGTTETPWGRKIEKPSDLKVTNADKRAAYNNRWEYNGLDRKKVKFDPDQHVLSADHMDIVHAAYDSPKFTLKREVLRMTTTDEWRRVPPMQAAQMIAEIYYIKRNIVLNVAKRRLRLIKKHLRGLAGSKYDPGVDLLLRDPHALREWVLKNKAVAARLNISTKNPAFDVLKKDPGRITDELRIVFATELENLQDLSEFAESFTSQL
tara:strand:+ start:406 stop:2001 length:1596 start_codon:yes stop_codon:yes gene_type:complete